MVAVGKQVIALFVDRASQQWVVRDSDGQFWIVPAVENAWAHREAFEPDDQTVLEPIPGHYKYLLQVPF